MRVAKTEDSVWILVGGYGCVSSMAKIIDAIHMNGRGGHSFGVDCYDTRSAKNEPVSLGGFDGDGWDSISMICAGVDRESPVDEEEISSSLQAIPDTFRNGDGQGDCILIVKGSGGGIEAIRGIFDRLHEIVSKDARENNGYGSGYVYTDDDEHIFCGSYWIDGDDGDGDNFGFAMSVADSPDLSDVLEWITNHGYDVNFYRRG